MTFATIEISQDNGKPLELLEIRYSQEVWHYTTAEKSIVYNGDTYLPLPMKRADLQGADDTAKSALSIQLPIDCPVGELFKIQPPSEVVGVTLFGQHYGDTEIKVLWKGRITNVKWVSPWLELNVENIFTSLQRVGLRRRYSAQCPYALYQAKCGLSSEAFKLAGVVSTLSGITLTVPSVVGTPNNHFAGGYISWTNNARNNPEFRMIRSSNGTTGQLTLSAQTIGLAVNQDINVFPGCDHLLTTCNTKFNNALNFGGTPAIPQKNPFGGSPIF